MDSKTLLIIKESYSMLKNLKLVEIETGIKWQTVYWHLKKEGVPITGDKARYGSATDRLAVFGEQFFQRLVPDAIDNNDLKWQSSIDFSVYGVKVDIKTSRLMPAGRNTKGKSFSARWCYCISKQQDIADYFVLLALPENDDEPRHIFLLPKELATAKTTISIPLTMKSKWADYKVSAQELQQFFTAFKKRQA